MSLLLLKARQTEPPADYRGTEEAGMEDVGHRRVGRIMREDNLLCLRKRKFTVVTTNSNRDRPVYPNLARDMVLSGINQLWVADITWLVLRVSLLDEADMDIKRHSIPEALCP